MSSRAVINLAPQHKFKGLPQLPGAQLMMLVPRSLWMRTRVYITNFEAVHLAGRFGAAPGDYEWELLENPQGLKWWRRSPVGDAAYCALLIAPYPTVDPVEVLGSMDIASDTPWWLDAIENEGPLQSRGQLLARQRRISLDRALVMVSIADEYRPRKLMTTERDENGVAWRVGDMEEVTRLKDEFIALVDRARTATLPNEVLPQTGDLSGKPRTSDLSGKLRTGDLSRKFRTGDLSGKPPTSDLSGKPPTSDPSGKQ